MVYGSAKVEPLHQLEAHRAADSGLAFRLDPFGERHDPQLLAHLDQRLDHPLLAPAVLVDGVNQLAVEFDVFRAGLDELRQAGLAGTEVVIRQPHVEVAEHEPQHLHRHQIGGSCFVDLQRDRLVGPHGGECRGAKRRAV